MDVLTLVPIIVAVSSIVPIAMGFWGLNRDRKLIEEGIRAEGLVVDFKSTGSTVAPIVEYQTSQGVVRAKSFYSASRILLKFKKGDLITIYYDRYRPKRFLIEGHNISTVLWYMCFLMGFINIAVGIFLYFIL